MTPLFWLLCLTFVLLVFLVLWILGKPFPRYRGGEPGEPPAPGQRLRALVGFLVGLSAGAAVGIRVFTWQPDEAGAGFVLPTHQSPFLSALCLGAGVGLPLAVLGVWVLTSRSTFQYLRAWDGYAGRGLDAVKAMPVAALLFLAMGYLHLPAWLRGDAEGLHYQTPLPWVAASHPWSQLRTLRAVEEKELLLDVWAVRPGLAWGFGDGARYRAHASDVVKTRELAVAARWSSRASGQELEHRKRDD